MFVEWIGKALAALPEKSVEGICHFCGGVTYYFVRGAVARRNISRAFPELDPKQVARLARETCDRTVELGMLSLAGRSFGEARWRAMIAVPAEVRATIVQLNAPEQKRGLLFLIPHTTLLEALTVLPSLVPELRTTNVLYRAFESAAVEKAVLKERTAYGAKLLSRSSGLFAIIRGLKRGENAALLFDQNSGRSGALISFMGRLAAATDLPDILARSAEVIPMMIAVERTGFWRGRLVMEALADPAARRVPLTIAAHRWLEIYLADPTHRSDWLWTHRRWDALRSPRNRLGLNHKTVLEIPSQKKFRVVVRLPDEAEAIAALKPLLARLRASRPDMELTLLGRTRYIDELAAAGLGERILGLPRGLGASVRFCFSLKQLDFDVALDFVGTWRSAVEVWASGAPQRFGWAQIGWPLITSQYNKAQKNAAKSETYEAFLKRFGMTG